MENHPGSCPLQLQLKDRADNQAREKGSFQLYHPFLKIPQSFLSKRQDPTLPLARRSCSADQPAVFFCFFFFTGFTVSVGREWELGLRRRCSGPALSNGYHRETHRRHGVGGGWGPQEAPALFTALLTAISAVNNPASVVTSGFIIGAFQLENYVREGRYLCKIREWDFPSIQPGRCTSLHAK